jgi:hypothetical protein
MPCVLGAPEPDLLQSELPALIRESTQQVAAHHAATLQLPDACADMDWAARVYCPSRWRIAHGGEIEITLSPPDAGETATIRLVPEPVASGGLQWHCSAAVPPRLSQLAEASGCRLADSASEATEPGSTTTAAAQSPAPVPAVTLATTPHAITVNTDGTVSVHADNVSPEWLLGKLQHARDALPPRAGDASDGCKQPDRNQAGGSERERTLRALREGSDADRYAAMLGAEENAIDIPDDLLRSTIESDASDRVRLMAFARYAERLVGDPESLRELLTVAAYRYSGALQAEARRQLNDLNEYEAMQANAPQQGAQ